MRINLATIDPTKPKEPKTLHDLQLLYENNVCPTINSYALKLFTKRELKRHIAIAMYNEGIKHKTKHRYWVIERVCWVLGLAKRTMEGYCPSRKQKTPQIENYAAKV